MNNNNVIDGSIVEEIPLTLNQRLDKIIEDREREFSFKKPGFWVDIEFTQEEKRLLIGLFGGRRDILDFFSKVVNNEDIYNIKEEYEKKVADNIPATPWWDIFIGSSILLVAQEVDLLWGVVVKVKKAIPESSEIKNGTNGYKVRSKVGVKVGSADRGKDKKPKLNKQQRESLIKWVDEIKEVNAMAVKEIKELEKKYGYSKMTIRSRINNDDSLIEDVTDRMLGIKKYNFYRRYINSQEKVILYEAVKTMLLNNLR